jgi:hypothetical protein
MFPHERSLVKQFEGKPFTLLGINSDKDRALVQKDIPLNEITWRSWCDGQGGPIAMRWRISSWPTFVLLDHKGVIRFKGESIRAPERLELAVRGLLQEMETTKVRTE